MKFRNFTIMFLFSLFLGLGISEAQTFTPITAVVTDPASVPWYNGNWSAKFYNPSSTLPPVYTKTGVKVQTIYSGVLDGTGAFSQSMPDTSSISPAGGSWIFTLCPDQFVPCQVMPARSLIGSSTINLSSFFTANLTIPYFSPPVTAYGYAQGYVNTPQNGMTLVTVPSSISADYSFSVYNAGTWHVIATSGGTGGCSTDCVITDPTGNQIVNQPSGTYLGIQGGFFAGDFTNNNFYALGINGYTSSDAQNNVVIGVGSFSHAADGANENVGIGGNNFIGNPFTGLSEIAIGYDSLSNDTTGEYNTAIGSGAGSSLTNGTYNLLLSPNAGGSLTSGDYNLAFGYNSQSQNSTGSDNVAIGYESDFTNTDSDDTCIGHECLYGATNGENIAIGAYAGKYASDGGREFFIGDEDYGSASGEKANDLIYGSFHAGWSNNPYLRLNATDIDIPNLGLFNPGDTCDAVIFDESFGSPANYDLAYIQGCPVITITAGSGISVSRDNNNNVTVTNTAVPSSTWKDVYFTETGCIFSSDGNGLTCTIPAASFSPAMADTSYTVTCIPNYSVTFMTTVSAMPALFASTNPVTTSTVNIYEQLNNGSSTGFALASNYDVTLQCHAHHN